MGNSLPSPVALRPPLLYMFRRAAVVLVVALATPATAQTGWTLLQNGSPVAGQEAPGTAAHAIRSELERGTAWLRSLAFRAPDVHPYSDGTYEATIKTDAEVDNRVGPDAIATYRWYNGIGDLTDDSRDLWLRRSALDSIEVDGAGRLVDPTPLGDGEALATTVHEVFHGVQAAYRDPYDGDGWIWEGMAEAVMHEWMRNQGRPYELRTTDYSDPLPESLDGGYDREHFWLSVGELLDPDHRVGYLRHVLEYDGDWEQAPVAAADSALRQTANQTDAIGPYRDGLYDLYPQVIAQHAGPEHFASVTPVDIGTPSTTTASAEIESLAAAALRVRVDVDEAEIDFRGVPIRFTLDVLGRDPTSPLVRAADPRDALHLIVGQAVAGRPALPETPYNHVVQVFSDTTLFVRVANVDPDPATGETIPFALRIESEGYYGDVIDAEGVAAPLPPGFAVNGPGPWSCRGGASARAVFDLVTPDELGQDMERAVPEMAQDMEDMMDDMEIALQRAEQMGHSTGMSREQIEQLRERARTEIERAQAESQPDIEAAADQARARRMTTLAATFVGQNSGEECQMVLAAELQGREGGAQILAGAVDEDLYPDGEEPGFDIGIYTKAFLDALRSLSTGRPIDHDPMDGWEVCTMTDEERQEAQEHAERIGCPAVVCTAGRLTLEEAEQGQIAGSFQFEVIRWPESPGSGCRLPDGRDTVTGHFNVASTDDGTDDNSLGGINLGSIRSGVTPVVPGTPILNPDDFE